MSAVFVSYARSTEAQAQKIAETLRGLGYEVWRDDELPAHRSYSEVIEERLRSAKAVVVIWSADAAKSQWVRAEADAARAAGTLVQVTVDGSLPPMPFNQIQCADLNGWSGDRESPGWRKVESSVASLAGNAESDRHNSQDENRRVSVCVLPFLNMSGDAEQEYFSDGISEDIITDLSKVSALSVVARNTAFTYKGKTMDVTSVARQLSVTHVLEGSVRKAGNRVRINAQLIDGEVGDHVWAERYDRDLTDIFAIQDEISKAIVGALQVKLLPKEKKAIEDRGTSNPEAYNLYLMARQHWISGNVGDRRRCEVVVRICRQATNIDPNYAKAWALMALAQAELRFHHNQPENALEAAEKALALDPNTPESYCVKARYLSDEEGKYEEAIEQVHRALQMSPDSWESNKEAAILYFRQARFEEAIPYFERAAQLVDTDFHSTTLLMTCANAVKDSDGHRRAAKRTVNRTERAIGHDPSNGSALGLGATALAALGDLDRAKEWASRAILMDPDNFTMRYNLTCAFAMSGDKESALNMLEEVGDKLSKPLVTHIEVDPDMDALRDEPRFQQMLAKAKSRVARGEDAGIPEGPEQAASTQ